jgi:hypothetical protein
LAPFRALADSVIKGATGVSYAYFILLWGVYANFYYYLFFSLRTKSRVPGIRKTKNIKVMITKLVKGVASTIFEYSGVPA